MGLETAAIIGLAGSAASAAGTIVGSSGGSAGMGERAQARESRIKAGLLPYQTRIDNAGVRAQTALSQAANSQNAQYSKAVGDFSARQLNRAGHLEQALGIQEASELRRDTEFVQSDLQANQAARGFTTTDATGLDLAMDVEERGDLLSRTALFSGLNARQGLDIQASAARAEGKNEILLSDWENKLMGMTGDMQISANKMAMDMERRGLLRSGQYYNMAARAAADAARRQRMASYFSAGSTLLGAGANAWGSRVTTPPPASGSPLK
jgi:hypothetical protein